tara:strand:+ start:2908 stop:3267 length:360 start_codon:yes stop_codon:yes gene_type:complete
MFNYRKTMNTKFKKLALSLSLMLPAYAIAADTTYSFDTVTAINLHSSNPSITGIEKNTGSPLTVSFKDQTNVSYRYVVNRCVPVFLTAMEKPGKYFLNLVVDPSASSVGLKSCQLEIKS